MADQPGATTPAGSAAPVTAAPVTAAPVTAAPVTAAPVTAAPVTAAPVTAAPATAAPVTAAPVPAAPVPATAFLPAFEYENNIMNENFNLRPRTGFKATIPEDQRKVSEDVYEARNVLKLLKEDNAITDLHFDEFIQRITQAGYVGCVAENVYPALASGALEQIRADIVRRAGTPLVYRYLKALARCALVGGVAGLVIAYIGISYTSFSYAPLFKGYGFVLIGAMAGAWFSVAASRWQIAFDTITDYPDIKLEPVIRMLFVALVAAAFALFLHLDIITIKIANVDFKTFISSISVALLVGFIAGISQRALSVQLVDRATKVLNPGK
jgi:hypothetical protein